MFQPRGAFTFGVGTGGIRPNARKKTEWSLLYMYVTHKLMGFDEISQDGERCLLRYAGGPKDYPQYLRVEMGL